MTWLRSIALTFTAGCTVGGGSTTSLSGSASAGGGDDQSGTTDAATTDGDDTDAETGVGSSAGSDSGVETGGDPSADSEDSAADSHDSSTSAASEDTAGSSDDGTDSSGIVDGVLDVTIIAHNDCTFTTMPSSITVPEGTEFTVNWISSGASEVEFDVAKIDQFNAVPIILGMEPGTSYHDEVREWCGDLFTGTFDFSLTSCFDPQSIPVDCGG